MDSVQRIPELLSVVHQPAFTPLGPYRFFLIIARHVNASNVSIVAPTIKADAKNFADAGACDLDTGQRRGATI
jgi:hypothetical protein